eukprot:GSChrysophyteH2.ASY1.ANO1.267.1 assembled CDS
MKWLAKDFDTERTRHKSNAKKLSKAIEQHFKTKDVRAAQKTREEGKSLKRISAKISRDVRKFWLKINKVIAFKQKSENDEVRQKAMDKHLVFLVKQTERYTNMLSENLAGGGALGSSHGKRKRTKGGDGADNDDSDGDESSIGGSRSGMSVETPYDEDSISEGPSSSAAALKRMRSSDASTEVAGNTNNVLMTAVNNAAYMSATEVSDIGEDEDDEFVPDDEQDDETTMIEEEATGEKLTAEEEVELLQKENEMSVEQLRAMYANMPVSDDERESSSEEEGEEEEEGKEESERSTAMVVSTAARPPSGSQSDDGCIDMEAAMKRLEEADIAARSIFVERPFVLSKNLLLREYQHIGLNWLVSLHERRLNGILADEMGLGKTVQTIAVLAYLMAFRGIWGPHLIVVPTSCLVNWEVEFKKFCPAFKILTYYGSLKQRKALRTGWSKLNSFNVCITSYQLVVQDSNAFRRKRWYYMVLDEAHNIKNFKSQRWQTLLNFNTQRRLLLTGTPLQNNLMELWNVAKQLPGKYEHILMCKLSKRQMFLYEEFMARSTVKNALTGGNFMGMMNCLMQLRKVCNHPDLFEVRAIESPFNAPTIVYQQASIITRAIEKSPFECLSSHLHQNLWAMNDDDLPYGNCTLGSVAARSPNGKASPGGSNAKSNARAKLEIREDYAQYLNRKFSVERNEKMEYNYNISNARCNLPRIGYSWNIVESCTVDDVVPPYLTISARYDAKKIQQVSSLWHGLVRSTPDRAYDMDPVIKLYTFVLPKATSSGPQLVTANPNPWATGNTSTRHRLCQEMKPIYEKGMVPFYSAVSRQRMYFPDKKLVQFDSGKLQMLATLLRKLKKGGHKCLIFTQMSKMLDILEKFLNLHAYTYVRLDGSTGVDKRQKLMDRFNGDPKLFVFILSTRSGGLGINLTGADTVIFYDSDWNPAMDAQAQDRAHRIGQTRDVHIYRLVSQSTVEENILTKARQKRHLDFLVMTEGNFSEESLFSSKGLKDLFENGEGGEGSATDDHSVGSADTKQSARSAAEIERAMAAAEDEEDISALKLARLEASKEEAEFDETKVIEIDESIGKEEATDEGSLSTIPLQLQDAATEEKDMEAEFASWQANIGPDVKALESALKPVERYALNLRTNIDPYYSMFFLTDQQRLESLSTTDSAEEMWNIEEIERQKEEEEHRALNEGELLAASLTSKEVSRFRSWYGRERKKRVKDRNTRILTGASWTLIVDDNSGIEYWYNPDTQQVLYHKPKQIADKEMMADAIKSGWNAIPKKSILKVLSFLKPYPERMKAALVCSSWTLAARDECFYLQVLPVESGARDETPEFIMNRYGPNAYPSLNAAVKASLAGDVIRLDAGHHWESSITINKSLRIMGATVDQNEPSGSSASVLSSAASAQSVVIELSDCIKVQGKANAVRFSHLTIRRPGKIPKGFPCFAIATKGVVSLYHCFLNNEGSPGGSVVS